MQTEVSYHSCEPEEDITREIEFGYIKPLSWTGTRFREMRWQVLCVSVAAGLAKG